MATPQLELVALWSRHQKNPPSESVKTEDKGKQPRVRIDIAQRVVDVRSGDKMLAANADGSANQKEERRKHEPADRREPKHSDQSGELREMKLFAAGGEPRD